MSQPEATLDLLVLGDGRMGRAVERAATARGHRIVSCWGRTQMQALDSHQADLEQADVAIDFTHASIVESVGQACLESGTALVSGTTGCDEAIARLRTLADDSRVGFLWAPNFSMGVQVLIRLVRVAASQFGSIGYAPYLSESHHVGKKDAPSGTARRLAEVVVEQTPRLSSYGPAPESGALPADRLSVCWTRAGSIPGSHRVGWDGPDETIEISHVARSRDLFAQGAVRAAEWLNGQQGARDVDQWIDELIRTPHEN